MTNLHLSGMDRVVPSKNRYKKFIIPGAIGLFVFIALMFFVQGLFVKTASVGSERIILSQVRQGSFKDSIPLNGNIVPISTVYLDAVEGGKVVSVHAEEGDKVQAGDSLITLENTNLQLEVIGREAQLTEQINNLLSIELLMEQNRLSYKRGLIDIDYKIDMVELKLPRIKAIQDSGGVAKQELDNAEVEYRYLKRLKEALVEAQSIDTRSQANQRHQLKQAVDNMTKNLGIARKNLEDLTIQAPIDGQLTMLDAEIGESLPKGQRVGQIDKVDEYKVSALVDEFYLGRLKVGQTGIVEINNDEYELSVTRIYPQVRNRQFEIDLLFEEKPESVRLGQTIRMNLNIGDESQSLFIDYGSFYQDTGGLWVYVVDEDGSSASKKSVTLGRQNARQVEVLDGLVEGQKVIVSSYENYLSAERIEIKK